MPCRTLSWLGPVLEAVPPWANRLPPTFSAEVLRLAGVDFARDAVEHGIRVVQQGADRDARNDLDEAGDDWSRLRSTNPSRLGESVAFSFAEPPVARDGGSAQPNPQGLESVRGLPASGALGTPMKFAP
jgi:hypothetical protein